MVALSSSTVCVCMCISIKCNIISPSPKLVFLVFFNDIRWPFIKTTHEVTFVIIAELFTSALGTYLHSRVHRSMLDNDNIYTPTSTSDSYLMNNFLSSWYICSGNCINSISVTSLHYCQLKLKSNCLLPSTHMKLSKNLRVFNI